MIKRKTSSIVNKSDYKLSVKQKKTLTQIKMGIHIGMLSIMDRQGSRHQLVCHQLQLHDLDIAVLTEAKLNRKHTINSYSYDIIATKTINRNQGEVAIIFKRNQD